MKMILCDIFIDSFFKLCLENPKKNQGGTPQPLKKSTSLKS